VVDLSDREHIRAALEGGQGQFIGTPVVGRVSGKPTVNITRPIRDAEGILVGVAVVSIDPLGLSDDMEKQFAGTDAVVVVLRRDGTVLARSTDPLQHVGSRLPDPLVARMTAATQGEAADMTGSDGRPAFASWRRVADGTVWLLHAQSADPVLRSNAEYAQRLRLFLLMGLFGAGTAGLLGFSLARQREQRAEAAKAEAHTREMIELVEALPGVAYRATLGDMAAAPRLHLTLPLARVFAAKGLAPADIPPLEQLLDAEGLESRAELMRAVQESGQASTDYRVAAPEIGTHWVREQCRVIRTHPDGRRDIVGLLSDITREREIAANAFTTSKLATLGEMATGVAHELNQPCAIIGIATEVALMEMEKGGEADLASARTRLEEVLTQTDRMRRIINHLRAFTRPDASPEEPLSLSAAMDGALGIATGVLRDNGIRVSLDLPGDLPKVLARLVPLEQVLVNLLLNARDAMADVPQAQRAIAIMAGLDPDRPGMVRLTIRDHGHGIPQDILPRVFEPFYTTRPVGKGTGLGLSIAYGTIRASGGMIEIANHPDGGVVATLWLQKA
jgi:C4-dicarboxylate-specific signal transduction histidine kinase